MRAKKASKLYFMSLFKEYYLLTKPGIVRGNLITAIAGFLFASQGAVDWWLLFATIIGTTTIIASGCVANNYMDREIDSKMKRTKNRALVEGRISNRAALTFSVILLIIGVATLLLLTNIHAVLIGIIGFVGYVFVYGYAKRHTIYSTLIGSVPGATPIAAGYVVATGAIDGTTLLLFMCMVFWQMPHFYAIGMYRKKEYAAADLPILPVQRSFEATRRESLLYTVAYLLAILVLAVTWPASIVFFVVMSMLCIRWIIAAGKRPNNATEENQWARIVFKQSLGILMVFSVLLSFDFWLP